MELREKRQDFLPYALPLLDEDDINEVVDTLRGPWLSKGPKTAKFEQQFAEFVGAKYAVAMNSATAALHIGLLALGVGPGDEVITTPMTFAASANVIIHSGATPVFVDVDPTTFNIDPSKLQSKITKRTKVILPVHMAGLSCDLDPIRQIASANGIRILEDAAHAVCTEYKGRMIGGISDATAFSFYATKNLVTGEGGMLTTNDPSVADYARIMSLHGMSKNAWNRYSAAGSWYYEILDPGFKYNMTDIQASLGLAQMRKLERLQGRRNEIARVYNEAFARLPGVTIPPTTSYSRHAWHLYILRINPDQLTINRDTFIEELKAENIGTSVHFIPVHLHPAYRQRFETKRGDYPEAEGVFERIISLPLYPKMSDYDVETVISAVTRIAGKFSR